MGTYTCASWEDQILSVPHFAGKNGLGGRCFPQRHRAGVRALEFGDSVQYLFFVSILFGETDFQN